MRWVRTPAIRPHRCAAIPFITNDQKGFIDTGYDLMGWDPHVYVSVTGVEQMARMIGWIPGGAVLQHEEDKKTLQSELQAARDEISQLRAQLDATEIVRQAILERSGS